MNTTGEPLTPHIRRAKPADADAICRLHVNSIRTVCAPDYTTEQIEAWAGRKRSEDYVTAMAQGEIIFVVECRQQIVGFASMGEQEVHGLYLAPQFLRRGLGPLLLKRVEQEFAARGAANIRLSSTLTAAAFYQAQGYQAIRRSHYRMGGVDIPCVEMAKELRKAG